MPECVIVKKVIHCGDLRIPIFEFVTTWTDCDRASPRIQLVRRFTQVRQVSWVYAIRVERPRRLIESRVSHFGAIGLALAGFTFWVLADTSMKLAGNSRLPAYEIVACQALVVAAAIALREFLRRTPRRLVPKSPARLAIRALLDLCNNLCVVVALRHLSLTLFYILVFLAPMATALLTAAFLRERLGWRKIVAVVGGFAGVVIAVNPFSAARQGDWIGYGACLVCVACFSVNMVWSRVLMRTEHPESLTLFSGVVQFAVCAGLTVASARPFGELP